MIHVDVCTGIMYEMYSINAMKISFYNYTHRHTPAHIHAHMQTNLHTHVLYIGSGKGVKPPSHYRGGLNPPQKQKCNAA